MGIKENLQEIQKRIQKAAREAGRNPSEVKLVLVTKNVPLHRIQEAYEAGARDFGENRVQEFLDKKPQLPADSRWHFVGHLQTNKVKSVLGESVLLHSLDRPVLAEAIEKQGEKKGLKINALVQVNVSGETTKSGFAPEEVTDAIEKISEFRQIELRGLMTIAPLTNEESAIRTSFRKLRELRETLKGRFPKLMLQELSMGMSSDFEIAIEEGATILRIGTAVFGERVDAAE